MPDATPPSPPVAAFDCPMCGGANGCAVAASGSFDTPCWCRDAAVPAAVLARVPDGRRGRSCICKGCAANGARPGAV